MYHKSSALTHRDKLLPHAGDAFTSDLTIQDLALARPFAQLAAFICYPKEKRIMEAYSSLMFVNQGRPFESEEISSLLGKITKTVMGIQIQINAFRHISIGFRRMLVDHASEASTQEDVMRLVEAEQAGHSDQVEQLIYAVSLDSLRGHSDQMVAAFCDASYRWQIKCGVVPTGVKLSYTDSKSAHFEELKDAGAFKSDDDEHNLHSNNNINSQVEHIVALALDKITPILQQTVINTIQQALATIPVAPLNSSRDRAISDASSVMSDIQPATAVSVFPNSKRPRHDTLSSNSDSEPAPIKRSRIYKALSSSEEDSDEEEQTAIKPQVSKALTFSALGPPEHWETLQKLEVMKEMTAYIPDNDSVSTSKISNTEAKIPPLSGSSNHMSDIGKTFYILYQN
ncbi:hypothetical protein F5878DRAFT_668088 [Lentinula raphanica]|uniref:Uncharacterized protein n=1 Tax=Lentinula raphanica TaxID=153919 RepID=A0AA38NUQ1_9AGAR|nr:hypothetical protein F5878DRAFT_668088 [Lentinula raphanica]